MIKTNQLSKCHNAPVVVCEGDAWDVKTVRDGSTYYYGCTKCREACDVSSDTNELDVTARKVLYILETRKTIPSDWTSTQVNQMCAKMIARHIHKYFELKGDI